MRISLLVVVKVCTVSFYMITYSDVGSKKTEDTRLNDLTQKLNL